MPELLATVITTIKDAARRLTGTKRRAFEAQVCIDYLDANPRKKYLWLGSKHRHLTSLASMNFELGSFVTEISRLVEIRGWRRKINNWR